LLLSCASARTRDDSIDLNIKPYVIDFVENSRGVVSLEMANEIPITIVDYKDDTNKLGTILATCYYSPYSTNYITINRKWWNAEAGPYYSRKFARVIWHELGHCVLGRDHTYSYDQSWYVKLLEWINLTEQKGFLKDGCPISLMHPIIVDDYCAEKHYLYYLQELYITKDKKML
jgi:hypothetical protein